MFALREAAIYGSMVLRPNDIRPTFPTLILDSRSALVVGQLCPYYSQLLHDLNALDEPFTHHRNLAQNARLIHHNRTLLLFVATAIVILALSFFYCRNRHTGIPQPNPPRPSP